jgi:hypothetical protein
VTARLFVVSQIWINKISPARPSAALIPPRNLLLKFVLVGKPGAGGGTGISGGILISLGLIGEKPYPSVSGNTKCCSREGRFVC